MLEADEPEALLSSLRRISERKAHAVMKGFLNGQIEGDEAQRWFNLAEALIKVEQELKDKKNG